MTDEEKLIAIVYIEISEDMKRAARKMSEEAVGDVEMQCKLHVLKNLSLVFAKRYALLILGELNEDAKYTVKKRDLLSKFMEIMPEAVKEEAEEVVREVDSELGLEVSECLSSSKSTN